MPGAKDFAALPTSWALTIWDALPLFLAVEAALVIILLATLPPRHRRTGWSVTASLLAGGGAYLLAFSSDLMAIYAAIVLTLLVIWFRTSIPATGPVPSSVAAGLLSRVWDVVGAIALSAAIAATVKIIGDPYLSPDHPAWLVIAFAAGLLPAGTLGTSVIPALAISAATDSYLSGAILLCAAAVRPYLLARVGRSPTAPQPAD